MKSTQITRSKAKTLAPGPSTPSTSQHPQPPLIIITEPSDDTTFILIQSPIHTVMLHEQTCNTPLHQSAGTLSATAPEATPEPAPAPTLPTIDPQLQATMTAMVEVMTCQFQVQLNVPPRARHCQAYDRDVRSAPHTWVKTKDPETYDRSDPAKLHALLSQCRLIFRAHPDDFEHDEVKITYAVSWLKGTERHCPTVVQTKSRT